jgi:hypothetical protein
MRHRGLSPSAATAGLLLKFLPNLPLPGACAVRVEGGGALSGLCLRAAHVQVLPKVGEGLEHGQKNLSSTFPISSLLPFHDFNLAKRF